jgi:hypothetical protein
VFHHVALGDKDFRRFPDTRGGYMEHGMQHGWRFRLQMLSAIRALHEVRRHHLVTSRRAPRAPGLLLFTETAKAEMRGPMLPKFRQHPAAISREFPRYHAPLLPRPAAQWLPGLFAGMRLGLVGVRPDD